MKKGPTNQNEIKEVEALEGIFRKTLTYNDQVMLCTFHLEAGAQIPLHNHEAHQIGYVLSGEVEFITETRGNFIAKAQDSYVFDSFEKHGAHIIKTAEIIEVFSPMREEYK